MKRFMAVTYTHSYSLVSIETLNPVRAHILVLHKPPPVIGNIHHHAFFHLTGVLFLGKRFNN